jgi:hypothetical protein
MRRFGSGVPGFACVLISIQRRVFVVVCSAKNVDMELGKTEQKATTLRTKGDCDLQFLLA